MQYAQASESSFVERGLFTPKIYTVIAIMSTEYAGFEKKCPTLQWAACLAAVDIEGELAQIITDFYT